MLVEEPLIVALEEQIQVLTHCEVKVSPLRLPGPVDVLRALVHEDQDEQDHCRRAEGLVNRVLRILMETRVYSSGTWAPQGSTLRHRYRP